MPLPHAPGRRLRRLAVVTTVAALTVALLPLPVQARVPFARERAGLASLADFDPRDPPFRVRAFDLRQLPMEDLYPHPRKLPPVASRPPTDAAGVPMRVENGERYYTPTGIAMEANRRLHAYVTTGNQAYLDVVVVWAKHLRTMMVEDERGALWLPFPWDNPNQGLDAPWDNALGQGSALAMYVRLYRLTGAAHWLAIADGLFASFLRLGPIEDEWVATVAPTGHLWLEHYPGGKRLRVLNSHLYAAFGLYDYWSVVGTDLSRLMTEAAFTTIRQRGLRFRREGTWSYYNLVRRAAHRGYHQFHIRQLRSAADATGDPWFDELANLFVEDYQP